MPLNLTYCAENHIVNPDLRKVVGKKRTRQSRKVLWEVVSLRFLDLSISGKSEKMARDAMDVCLQVLKENNKSRFDSYSVRNVLLIISQITFWDRLVRFDSFRQPISEQLYVVSL